MSTLFDPGPQPAAAGWDSAHLPLLPMLAASQEGAPLQIAFRMIDEPIPGAQWAAEFAAMWPAYRAWYLKEGEPARPDLLTCRRMLERWLPELVPAFEQLVELAGGDPLAARFLSLYGPPGFVVGCSQAAFTGEGGPVLVRNYDYPAARAEGIVYLTAWTGRRVIGMSDCLWGLVDGVNDAGLAISLTFGGRRQVGAGFGVPIVIRYLLEVASTVEEACALLARIPIHTAQNVTLLDTGGDRATVRVGPGRGSELLNTPVATNHQRIDDWPEYARAVDSFERKQLLARLVADEAMTAAALIDAFMAPPLYRSGHAKGVGTLYTAAYYPGAGAVEYRWPGHSSFQSFAAFVPQHHVAVYPVPTAGG